jgi:hypothetical protein
MVYLILSHSHSYFNSWGIEITDSEGNMKPIVEWPQSVKIKEKNRGFIYYVYDYMKAMYTLIHDSLPPRELPVMRHFLQVSKDTRMGELYLVQCHTII